MTMLGKFIAPSVSKVSAVPSLQISRFGSPVLQRRMGSPKPGQNRQASPAPRSPVQISSRPRSPAPRSPVHHTRRLNDHMDSSQYPGVQKPPSPLVSRPSSPLVCSRVLSTDNLRSDWQVNQMEPISASPAWDQSAQQRNDLSNQVPTATRRGAPGRSSSPVSRIRTSSTSSRQQGSPLRNMPGNHMSSPSPTLGVMPAPIPITTQPRIVSLNGQL